MPHYDPERHHGVVSPGNEFTLDHPPTEENVVLPWHVADTTPQPVVPSDVMSNHPDTARLPEPTDAELTEYARRKMHRRVDAEGFGIALSGDEEDRHMPSHRGQPKRGFRWGVFVCWLLGGIIIALWLVLVYNLGTDAQKNRPQPVRTVTETPAARPGPRVTVRVPGAPRVVTRTRTNTVRATVTRRVPGPTVTVTTTPPIGGANGTPNP